MLLVLLRCKAVRVLGGGSHTTCNPPQSLSCDYQLSSNISNPSEWNEGSQTPTHCPFFTDTDVLVNVQKTLGYLSRKAIIT